MAAVPPRDAILGVKFLADFAKEVLAAIAGAGVGAWLGARLAFRLEHDRRESDRVNHELGQCNALQMSVMTMASTLIGLNEQLFGKPGSDPKQWGEIGILNGAPRHGPEFAFSDYAFLLDGTDTESPAPTLLSRIAIATTNFEANLEWLHARNALWTRAAELDSALSVAMGQDADSINSQLKDASRNIKHFTEWLRESVPESIVEIEAIQPLLHQVLRTRYPKRQLLYSKPL